MATNTMLTPTAITREALMILHQKLGFIGNITRQYDDRFARDGAKIGTTLQIRKPVQFTVRSGSATYSAQNLTEEKVDLTVATQSGVDFEFSSAELTMKLDDFSDRYLKPAMSVLAANIESTVITGCYKGVANYVDGLGAGMTFNKVLTAGKVLTDNLTPYSSRKVLLDTQSRVDLTDALKGLMNDQSAISKQYREGQLGRIGGFDFYESTLMPRHTTGTAAATTGYLTNDAVAQTGSTLTVDTGTTTFLVGDIITIDGVYDVHPETKATLSTLKRFVVTANSGSSATSLSISPAIVASGARQNVSNAAANDKAITKYTGASDVHDQSLAFHPEAFAFASADLQMPKGTDMASRQVMDGLSLRFVRDYDVSDDQFKSRFDIYYGYAILRPELACRICVN